MNIILYIIRANTRGTLSLVGRTHTHTLTPRPMGIPLLRARGRPESGEPLLF